MTAILTILAVLGMLLFIHAVVKAAAGAPEVNDDNGEI
jgi:hypothetical protein